LAKIDFDESHINDNIWAGEPDISEEFQKVNYKGFIYIYKKQIYQNK
jgi:hypothetical protein